ncbi:glycoside hydrolase family 78 protein [Saccharicrinis sp. FJH62]|uniref:glycoside hydrolase family 78 protein n=1 Tax=Saccharicrinis sp. FJH62 TaxID=3344657 RepID=UPI0035D520A2
MQSLKSRFIISSLLILFAFPIMVSSKTNVNKLVCEYKTNPIGIGTVQPRLSWQINTTENNVSQMAYEIKAFSGSANDSDEYLVWSTGKVPGSQSVNIVYTGEPLQTGQHVNWKVRIWDQNDKATKWSDLASWEMGVLEPESWKANWISVSSEPTVKGSKPCQYFRKDFSSDKKIASARVYVTSRGLYQLFINGEKVSKDLFTPGWTSYNNRIQYQTYDVTNMIKAENTIGAILGDGWYRGYIGFNNQQNYYGDKLALLAQLVVTYTDGTKETIVTDNNWKWSTGPILFSDIYNGETYDARLEQPGWDDTNLIDASWQNVSVETYTKDDLIAPQGVPVRDTKEIKPLRVFQTPNGETVFDLGQNMVGWVRLKVQGNKGDKVTLKFAEVLDKEGNFYTANLRNAKATDNYILKGNGEEIYEPHFTFHGFRFVQLEGYPGTPHLDAITGIVIHSDMEPTGSFSCSDPLINQLQHNIQWGQKGNFLDIPTDCPQRDERLGWTGDAQVFSMTAAYNFNVAGFYTKWMKDLAADQLPDGKVPHVIPDVLNGGGGATAWADASIIIPWTVYRVYGDTRILKEQYNSMKGWVEYMKGRAGNDLIWTGDYHFGDWLAFATTWSDYPGATTEKDLIATAYFCYSSHLLSKIAGILGNTEDEKKYAQLSNQIKQAFNAEFITPNGRLVSHTQTAYALVLSFNLLPDNLKDNAAKYLAEDVKKFGHLTTGFVGTPLLCSSLSSTGRDDLAFMLLMRKDYPSWLYPVTQGATTIWERWDGQKPDGSFQDVGMNSFNHYAYGAIGEWLYTYVAGIRLDPDQPGYKHFFLSPHVGGGLTYANASFNSMYGLIRSDWKVEGKTFVYEVEIPANTMATVILPNADIKKLMINDKPANKTQHYKAENNANGLKLTLGSGIYTLKY